MFGTALSGVLTFGIITTFAAAILLLTDQNETAFREFTVMGLFCSALIMISYYTELNAPGVAAKISAVKFGYLGRVFITPMLLMLVLRHYRAKVAKLWLLLLYLIPLITLMLVFTCEQHQLYYVAMEMTPEGLLRVIPGPFYFVYMAYNTVLSMILLSYCLYQRVNLRGREKSNNTILMLACLIPFLSLLLYLSGWTQGYDVSSVGVMAGALLVALSVLRFGLLNKEEMLQNMATGLVFLDNEYQLVYANKKAIQIIPMLGQKLVRTQRLDLKQLCSEEYASIQVGSASYQRKITEWTNGEGQSGKLLTFDDITEIRARLNRDAMTGLLNHACFYPMLDDAMSAANQQHKALTVSIADINSFKHVNDTYGHTNGDIILIALSETLQRVCGRHGEVFRYGGEEFAVIFHGNYEFAEKTMQEALDAFCAVDFDFLPYKVSFSFGSAEFDGLETSVALFDRADHAMYSRKAEFHRQERAEAEARSKARAAEAEAVHADDTL